MQQEQVFNIAFHHWPELGRKYLSPLRPDRNPGCFYTKKNGWLRFWDNSWGINCWDAVALTTLGKQIETPEELKEVNKIIKNRLGNTRIVETPSVDFKFNLTTVKKDWNFVGLKWWSDYGITEAQLRADKKYMCDSFTYNSKGAPFTYTTKKNKLSFVYEYPSGHKKVYNPGDPLKWLTNCTPLDVDFEHNDRGDEMIILGSYKDARVVKNYGYDVRGLQSETQLPDELLLKWSVQYKRLYYLGDIDSGGLENTNKIIKRAEKFGINLKPLYITPRLEAEYGIKDISEFEKQFRGDTRKLIEYLK